MPTPAYPISLRCAFPLSGLLGQHPRSTKNVALCGLRLDGFHALLVQGRIAYSVGSGSEKSVSDARSVNASAAPLTPRVLKLL